MNLFAQSANFLGQRLNQVAGRRCLYVRVRGSEEWPLTVPREIRQYTIYEEQDWAGTVITAHDWLIPVADLPITPRDGDTIEDEESGETFMVLPIKPEPSARPLDSQGQIWLVHSKLREVDDA